MQKLPGFSIFLFPQERLGNHSSTTMPEARILDRFQVRWTLFLLRISNPSNYKWCPLHFQFVPSTRRASARKKCTNFIIRLTGADDTELSPIISPYTGRCLDITGELTLDIIDSFSFAESFQNPETIHSKRLRVHASASEVAERNRWSSSQTVSTVVVIIPRKAHAKNFSIDGY